MEREHDTMMTPPIEDLLDRVDSKFGLVTLAARRAHRVLYLDKGRLVDDVADDEPSIQAAS